jgi:hypothetical protein
MCVSLTVDLYAQVSCILEKKMKINICIPRFIQEGTQLLIHQSQDPGHPLGQTHSKKSEVHHGAGFQETCTSDGWFLSKSVPWTL